MVLPYACQGGKKGRQEVCVNGYIYKKKNQCNYTNIIHVNNVH